MMIIRIITIMTPAIREDNNKIIIIIIRIIVMIMIFGNDI